MKKIFMVAVLALASVLMLNSCSSGEGSGSKKVAIVGCWQLQWSDTNIDYADVYVEFNEDKTFHLYQRLQAPTFVHYSGTYLVADGILSGQYDDLKPWGSSYNIDIEGDVMTLTSTTNSVDISVFNRCEQRSDVKATVSSAVRSALDAEEFRFF